MYSRSRTLCVLDFDDTLFPTTAYTTFVHCLEAQRMEKFRNLRCPPSTRTISCPKYLELFSKWYHNYLELLQDLVIKIVRRAAQLFGSNNVYIVTNADQEWISTILNHLMPRTLPLLKSIKIVSARVLAQIFEPHQQSMWKIYAFHQIVQHSFGLTVQFPGQETIDFHLERMDRGTYTTKYCPKQTRIEDRDQEGSVSFTRSSTPTTVPSTPSTAFPTPSTTPTAGLTPKSSSPSFSFTLDPEFQLESESDSDCSPVSYTLLSIGDSQGERLACKTLADSITLSAVGALKSETDEDDEKSLDSSSSSSSSFYKCVGVSKSIKFKFQPNMEELVTQLQWLCNKLEAVSKEESDQDIVVPCHAKFLK